MGTRSLITFIKLDPETKKETPLVAIYQMYDGYLNGVGKELCEWLSKKKMINGLGFYQNTDEYVNGIGCLAAQFIRDFKIDVGGLYIYPIDCERRWIDYCYDVVIDNQIYFPLDGIPVADLTKIRVSNWQYKPFFEGTVEELMKYKEPEEDG